MMLWAAPVVDEEGNLICNVGLINLATVNSFFMGTSTTITIKPENLRDWLLLLDPAFRDEPLFKISKSYRKGPWGPLILAN